MGLLGGGQGPSWAGLEQGEGFLILLSSDLSTGPAATQGAPMGSLDSEKGSEAGLCVARGPELSEPGETRFVAKWPEAGLTRARLHPVVGLTPGMQDGLVCRVTEEPGVFCPHWQDNGAFLV